MFWQAIGRWGNETDASGHGSHADQQLAFHCAAHNILHQSSCNDSGRTHEECDMLQPRERLTPMTGIVRPLRHSELRAFEAHLLRLDAESRRDRFNGPANDHFVSGYAERSFHDGTIVIGYVEDGRVLGAAELHERPEDDVPTGEIAFSVEREMQHRGLGAALFAQLVQTAKAFGYQRLRVTTHPQNEAMKRLARRFSASLRFEDGETVGVIDLGPASALPARPGAGAFLKEGVTAPA